MAFVAHAQPQLHSEFNYMDDTMEISSDTGHRNMGDDDDIDIDIDLHPDRGDGNANDDFMADNPHHNPDDDLMFDENAAHDDNPLENMEQDNVGQQYEQLQDVQDQYPPQSAGVQQPPYDLAQNPNFDQRAQHSSSITPKPAATFQYPPNQDPNQFYPPQFEHAQHSDPNFHGHPPQFQYPPQNLGQYPPENAPSVQTSMVGNSEGPSTGYDQPGDLAQQASHEIPDQSNGYGLSNTAASAQGNNAANNTDPSQALGNEQEDTLQVQNEPQPTSTMHPVVVNWKGDHFSLFPGMEDDPYEGYFLEDTAPAFSTVSSLMDSLRQVLDEDCPASAELRLAFPALGLTLTQSSSSNSSATLVDIIDVYISLCQNDGIDYPEPLEAILSTRQDPDIRIAELRQALEQGKGLSHVVAETWNAEDSDNSFDDESPGYPGASTAANGDDETADELDEYKEVYEDISAVVKELKTLAPEVEVPPETSDAQGSASSDNEDADGEQPESEEAQEVDQSNGDEEDDEEDGEPDQGQEQSLDEHDDLLDEDGDDEPVDAAKADKPQEAPSKSDPFNGQQTTEDDQASGINDESNTSPTGDAIAAANKDLLSNKDPLEDPVENTEPSNEESFLEESYLETQDDAPAESNEHPQDGLDLLDDTEGAPEEHNEVDDLLEDHEDEAALDDQQFNDELGRTDLEVDQLDDFEGTTNGGVSTSSMGKALDTADATGSDLGDAATLSNKRPREELGLDELESGADANDAKRRRSG